MSKEELPIYLNDHLAGSVGALELLDRLIQTYKGKPLEQFFNDLRNEIDADQDTLQDLIENSARRKARCGKLAHGWPRSSLARRFD
jgi:hypothetical protein